MAPRLPPGLVLGVIVKRFFDPKLAQTSYLIGCGRDGVALVIDPNREAAP